MSPPRLPGETQADLCSANILASTQGSEACAREAGSRRSDPAALGPQVTFAFVPESWVRAPRRRPAPTKRYRMEWPVPLRWAPPAGDDQTQSPAGTLAVFLCGHASRMSSST